MMFDIKEFKLAAISEMPDEVVEQIFLNSVIKSEDEIGEIFAILEKYRPALLKKFEQEIKRIKRRYS